MYLVQYNAETGTVLGIYDQTLNYPSGIPTPNIQITVKQHADFFVRGQNHRVIDGVWTYVEPPGPTTEEKLTALDAEYQPQFVSLAQALGLATLDNNHTVMDGIKFDYVELKAEYQTKREGITSDN
jgi:hypothetical protein